MIASGNAYGFAGGIFDRFDLALVVQLKQVAIGRAGSHPPSWCNAALRNFDEINRISRPANSDDCPLPTSFCWIFPPKDLG